ncbi:hypothetical protein E2542_SST21689 [Spatholobus suberectus]|nr:hypothetical protein E2542_SST21689 [Spatholobus suberectus]
MHAVKENDKKGEEVSSTVIFIPKMSKAGVGETESTVQAPFKKMKGPQATVNCSPYNRARGSNNCNTRYSKKVFINFLFKTTCLQIPYWSFD